jgi:hypothetical protein
MPKPITTDAEFIEVWNTHKSPSKVAEALGMEQRNVHSRRRAIEMRHGIKLEALDAHAKHYTHLQTAHQHPQRYDLGILNGTVICWSDAHFWPGIRTTAFRGLLWALGALKPKACINGGDAFDGASISRHPRIGWDSTPSVIQELKACEAALGEIEEAAKAARHNIALPWCLGNHDSRLESRLAANAPEFQGGKGFTLKDHFPAWKPCWAVWNGDTIIKHRMAGGVHATHANVLKAGKSVVTGHLHSLRCTPYDDYNDYTRYGVDTGTLAEPNGPQFSNYLEEGPVNWRSGFAVLTFFEGRLMWPEFVKKWDENHVEFRGKVIDVSSL